MTGRSEGLGDRGSGAAADRRVLGVAGVLAVVAVVVAAFACLGTTGCGGEDGDGGRSNARTPEGGNAAGPSEREIDTWVRDLGDPEPDARLRAVEALGRSHTSRADVFQALIESQEDPVEEVGAAALAALDALHPPPDVAVKIRVGVFEEVEEQVLVSPARTSWVAVECEPYMLAAGERQGKCWMLAVIPAVYEGRTRRVRVGDGPSRWRPSEEVLEPDFSAPASTPLPGAPPTGEESPAGLSGLEARPGEVWCHVRVPAVYEEQEDGTRVEVVPARREFRRNEACEVPMEAPAVR